MNKLLNVRRVGFLQDMPGDTRSPESFAFPACLTSMLECMGEDVKWETIEAHNRKWTQRFINKEILSASGMAFGLLWHPEICPSSFDLMQVNPDHADTIRLGFGYAGYECEILGGGDADLLRARLVQSIDTGRPVLGFGVGEHPECSIVCGYEDDGARILGWNPYQGVNMKVDFAENGMFLAKDWEKDVWSLALCGEKKQAKMNLKSIVERGVGIMQMRAIGGYLAGDAAYGAWRNYVSDEAFENMDEGLLKQRHWYHHALTGSHAEARCYLGNYLHSVAHGDELLIAAANCLDGIHSACWELWGVLGGIGAEDGYLGLRDAKKRSDLAAILEKISALDQRALASMQQWLARDGD